MYLIVDSMVSLIEQIPLDTIWTDIDYMNGVSRVLSQ